MRSSGLNDFMRKENARRVAGKAVNGANATMAVLTGAMVGHPGKLPPAQERMLKALASPECFRCRGVGVSKWRDYGRQAVVCGCVQRRIPDMEKALAAQQEQLQQQLDALKARGQMGEVVPRVEDGVVKFSVEVTRGSGSEGGPEAVAPGEARQAD